MSDNSSITMSDIARLANVSLITVSRVLNQPDKVSERTRQRVLEIVERTGYVPNNVAGSLASRRTNVVAAFIPTITNSIFADTISGLTDVLNAAGYHLMLGVTGYSLDKEAELLATTLAQRPAGLVMTGLEHAERTMALARGAHIPVVETWNARDTGIDMTVGFSNYQASYAMVERLISLGCRCIGYVGAPTEANDRARDRLRGYRDALTAHDMPVVEDRIRHALFSFQAGADHVMTLHDTAPDLDAVFCANDVLAIGAVLECQRRGISVPDELTIAGFDDIELASQINPGLTTVRLPRYEIGAEAARMILSRIDEPGIDIPNADLEFEIIERGSTPKHRTT